MLIPYEQLLIQTFHHNVTLVPEQSHGEHKPLFQLTIDTDLASQPPRPINTSHRLSQSSPNQATLEEGLCTVTKVRFKPGITFPNYFNNRLYHQILIYNLLRILNLSTYNKLKTNCNYFYTIASTCFTFPCYITLLVHTLILCSMTWIRGCGYSFLYS